MVNSVPIKHRLVFVSGICGSGKSTVTQELAFQLMQNGYNVKWMHEECKNNPLRGTKKNLKKSGCTNLARYFDWTIDIWKSFIDVLRQDDRLYVVDGYIFQSTVLNLFNDGYSSEIIQEYFDRFARIINPAKPLVINLFRADILESFRNTWKQRGNEWKKISIDIPTELPEQDIDYRYYEEKGIAAWKDLQELNSKLLETSVLKYIRINTAKQQWPQYYRRIAGELGFLPVQIETVRIADNRIYCGEYSCESKKKRVIVKSIDNKLYCEIFFPFMRLIPDSDSHFHIRGLPINIVFHSDESGMMKSFVFVDDYDWGLTGALFARKYAG